MSIASKLTQIAENEQRVYDAGYNAGFEAGKAEGGGGGAVTQTWTLNSSGLDLSTNASWEIPFTTLGTISNGSEFVKLEIKDNKDLYYYTAAGESMAYYSTDWGAGGVWGPPDYNVLTFTTALPDDLAAWLAANGTQTA